MVDKGGELNIDEFTNKNTESCIVGSEGKDEIKKKGCWVGIDEAGRGPVLGKQC